MAKGKLGFMFVVPYVYLVENLLILPQAITRLLVDSPENKLNDAR